MSKKQRPVEERLETRVRGVERALVELGKTQGAKLSPAQLDRLRVHLTTRVEESVARIQIEERPFQLSMLDDGGAEGSFRPCEGGCGRTFIPRTNPAATVCDFCAAPNNIRGFVDDDLDGDV